MTDETRARLRGAIELLVSYAARLDGEARVQTDSGRLGAYVTYTDHVGVMVVVSTRPEQLGPPTPALTPFQHMCLSGLLGDPDQLPQALADYMLDQGHEYAAACYQKGKRDGNPLNALAKSMLMGAEDYAKFIEPLPLLTPMPFPDEQSES